MNEIKTEIYNFNVIFPAQRWLPESRMTTTFIPMGGNLYRLNEGFLCGPISFGDVIEALPTDNHEMAGQLPMTALFLCEIRASQQKTAPFGIKEP